MEEAGLPAGTSITIRDLFFNTPARKKFLKAESTELSHIASLVTHYALAHPEKHFELHSATNAVLVASPVADHSQRVYQVFGREVLDQLIPVAAMQPLERIGLPQPPPWRRHEDDEAPAEPGELRVHGFVSKPEIQKLNRNSIYIFVNGRLIRDRLIQHAITEGYRNILPPTVYPVVLLFLEMPSGEVDVNVHPSKTEVRFRQQSGDSRFCAGFGPSRADEGPAGSAICHRNQRPSHSSAGADAGSSSRQPGFFGSLASALRPCRGTGLYPASSGSSAGEPTFCVRHGWHRHRR